MRLKQSIVLATVFVLCLSTAQVRARCTWLVQNAADSIVVSGKFFVPNTDKVNGNNNFFEVKSSNEDDIVTLKIFNFRLPLSIKLIA
jgi:hypothetical protein